MHPVRKTSRLSRRRQGGFTLIEAALTTIIVGTGVLAIVAAQQAYHQKSDWAQRTGTAMLLANEVRELLLPLPENDPLTGNMNLGPEAGEATINDFDDLDDFAGAVTAGVGVGQTFSPPVNGLRETIPNMNRWRQQVEVVKVLEDNISSTLTQPLTITVGVLTRVTVTVQYNEGDAANPNWRTVNQLTWVAAR